MALLRRNEVELAVAVLGVVPAHKLLHPYTGLIQRGEAGRGPLRAVLQYPEQGLDKGIVIADPRTAVGWQHAQFLQLDLHSLGLHRCAIVRGQHQGLVQALLT